MTRELERPLPRSWWLRKAAYFQFMMRELTSLAVLAYAVLMVWGLWAAADARSFSAFHDFLTSPLSVWLHILVWVLAFFHTGTWIALTPKVLVVWRGDQRLESDVIAAANAFLFLTISGALFWLVLR